MAVTTDPPAAGPDTDFSWPLFVHVGGGAADEALATLGQVGAHGEVLLAAGTGDMVNSRGLRGHLAVQVDIHGAVDGDEVVDLRHPAMSFT